MSRSSVDISPLSFVPGYGPPARRRGASPSPLDGRLVRGETASGSHCSRRRRVVGIVGTEATAGGFRDFGPRRSTAVATHCSWTCRHSAAQRGDAEGTSATRSTSSDRCRPRPGCAARVPTKVGEGPGEIRFWSSFFRGSMPGARPVFGARSDASGAATLGKPERIDDEQIRNHTLGRIVQTRRVVQVRVGTSVCTEAICWQTPSARRAIRVSLPPARHSWGLPFLTLRRPAESSRRIGPNAALAALLAEPAPLIDPRWRRFGRSCGPDHRDPSPRIISAGRRVTMCAGSSPTREPMPLRGCSCIGWVNSSYLWGCRRAWIQPPVDKSPARATAARSPRIGSRMALRVQQPMAEVWATRFRGSRRGAAQSTKAQRARCAPLSTTATAPQGAQEATAQRQESCGSPRPRRRHGQRSMF